MAKAILINDDGSEIEFFKDFVLIGKKEEPHKAMYCSFGCDPELLAYAGRIIEAHCRRIFWDLTLPKEGE